MSTRGDYTLQFPARKFEDHVVVLVVAVQFAIGIVAVLALAFWLLVAPSRDGNWYIEILALSLSAGLLAYLLSYVYRNE